jgi:hypothetical protein
MWIASSQAEHVSESIITKSALARYLPLRRIVTQPVTLLESRREVPSPCDHC